VVRGSKKGNRKPSEEEARRSRGPADAKSDFDPDRYSESPLLIRNKYELL